MAAGTAHRQSEECRTYGVGHLGQDFVAAEGDALVAGVAPQRTQAVEPCGDEQLGVVGVDLVTGQLLLHETVVGYVVIEGLDDVVAIAPGPRPMAVVLEAFGLGKPDDVEPVPPPPFAVMRAV